MITVSHFSQTLLKAVEHEMKVRTIIWDFRSTEAHRLFNSVLERPATF